MNTLIIKINQKNMQTMKSNYVLVKYQLNFTKAENENCCLSDI